MLISVLVASMSDGMEFKLQFGEMRGGLDEMVGQAFVSSFGSFLSLLVFLTVIGTAGFMPGMLSKGRAEYFLSKPVSRTRLYLQKVISLWLVYGAAIVLAGVVIVGKVLRR